MATDRPIRIRRTAADRRATATGRVAAAITQAIEEMGQMGGAGQIVCTIYIVDGGVAKSTITTEKLLVID
jgi:hypothetical protein